MKLQQLRCVYEIVNCNFNVSHAAENLHTSQPGVSKQIQLLEDEIKVKIFVRNGKRLVGLSEPGHYVYEAIGDILKKVKNIRHISIIMLHRKMVYSLLQRHTHRQDINCLRS